jgi:hypothetical protein
LGVVLNKKIKKEIKKMAKQNRIYKTKLMGLFMTAVLCALILRAFMPGVGACSVSNPKIEQTTSTTSSGVLVEKFVPTQKDIDTVNKFYTVVQAKNAITGEISIVGLGTVGDDNGNYMMQQSTERRDECIMSCFLCGGCVGTLLIFTSPECWHVCGTCQDCVVEGFADK